MNETTRRVYRLLVRWVAPAELRREYGPEMEEVFIELLTAARARGRLEAARVWWREAIQLAGLVRWMERRHSVRDVLDGGVAELRTVGRGLVRSPLFTLGAVLTLGVGLGLPVAVYSVARASVLAPIPVPEPESVVLATGVESSARWSGRTGLSALEVGALMKAAESLEAVAAFSLVGNVTLATEGEAVRLDASFVSPSYFDVFRAVPHIGRLFTDVEGASGAAEVVLSYATWVGRFGADPEVVGRTVRLAGVPYEVIGVTRASFVATGRMGRLDAWLPYDRAPDLFGADILRSATRGMFWAVGRLASGSTPDDGARELAGLHEDLRTRVALPDERSVGTMGLREFYYGGAERPLRTVALGSVIVLLVCGLNLTFLIALRSKARAREFAVRVALGASRRHRVRAEVTEAALLAMAGTLLAFGITRVSVSAFLSTVGGGLLLFDRPRVGFGLWAASWSVALLVGAAAMAGGRVGVRSGHPRAEGVGVTSERAGWLRWVVGSEVTLAVVVLVAATLSVRSLQRLDAVPLGYAPDGLQTVRLNLTGSPFADVDGQRAFVRTLSERLSGRGVEIGLMGPDMMGRALSHVHVASEPSEAESGQRLPAQWISLTPGTLEALGMELLEGRDVAWTDQPGQPVATLVSERLARAVWHGESPLGRAFHLNGSRTPNAVVVGIVKDARHVSRYSDPYAAGEAYFAFPQRPTPRISVLYRSPEESAFGVADLRRAIADLDGGIALFDVKSMRDRLRGEEAGVRLVLWLAVVYSAITVFLTLTGVAVLIATSVHARRAELAVRGALGASRSRMVWSVARGTTVALGTGVVVGCVLAGAGTRSLESFLFGVSPTDPVTYAVVILSIGTLGLVAAWMPARRAASINPTEVLRSAR